MNADAHALHYAVTQFLYQEARLLDEQRWEEWGALFTEDGIYWAPASVDQPDPINHVSLIYEDGLLRKVRLARYKGENAFALQPFPRSTHLIGNVMIDSDAASVLEVTSRFVMYEYRRDQKQALAGEYKHTLTRENESFRIKRKKVTLVDCEGPREGTSLYF